MIIVKSCEMRPRFPLFLLLLIPAILLALIIRSAVQEGAVTASVATSSCVAAGEMRQKLEMKSGEELTAKKAIKFIIRFIVGQKINSIAFDADGDRDVDKDDLKAYICGLKAVARGEGGVIPN